jgi:hypothetical protein
VPKPVRIAFRSFSDIKDPRTYVARNESLLLQTAHNASVNPDFNLTEWWRIAKGKKLSRLFNVGNELVARVLQVLERVSTLFYMYAPSEPGTERLSSAELCARTVKNFKEALQQCKEIESHIDLLMSFLKDEYHRLDNFI